MQSSCGFLRGQNYHLYFRLFFVKELVDQPNHPNVIYNPREGGYADGAEYEAEFQFKNGHQLHTGGGALLLVVP